MKKVLVAYLTTSGTTGQMAEYIAEGIRFSGQTAIVKKIEDIATTIQIEGYDGYIFGSPTYSLDMPNSMTAFLTLARKVNLEGKLGGAFGPYAHDIAYRHDTYAPTLIFDHLQNSLNMKPFDLGPFILREDLMKTSEGMKTCQDYGRVFGEKLNQ